MKRLVCALAVWVCLVSAGTSHAGLAGFMSAKVSGTVQQSVPLDPSGQKIVTTKLSNAAIFDMFAVSPDDYELVMTFSGVGALELLPKSLLAKLPTIIVLEVEDPWFLVDTKSNQEHFGGGLSSPASSGLFHNFVGGTSGAIKFSGPGFPKAVSLTGEGASTSSESVVKLKVSTHGVFVQSGP
jgi:hypothetical protein